MSQRSYIVARDSDLGHLADGGCDLTLCGRRITEWCLALPSLPSGKELCGLCESEERRVVEKAAADGRAFKFTFDDFRWEEHETAAWIGQGLHGWVDRASPLYSGTVECSVKQGPFPLWRWRVRIERAGVRYQASGYLQSRPTATFADHGEMRLLGKRACFGAFRVLLAALVLEGPQS